MPGHCPRRIPGFPEPGVGGSFSAYPRGGRNLLHDILAPTLLAYLSGQGAPSLSGSQLPLMPGKVLSQWSHAVLSPCCSTLVLALGETPVTLRTPPTLTQPSALHLTHTPPHASWLVFRFCGESGKNQEAWKHFTHSAMTAAMQFSKLLLETLPSAGDTEMNQSPWISTRMGEGGPGGTPKASARRFGSNLLGWLVF